MPAPTTTDADADQRQRRDLRKEMEEDSGAVGADAAHDGNDRSALGHIKRQSDADAADDKTTRQDRR